MLIWVEVNKIHLHAAQTPQSQHRQYFSLDVWVGRQYMHHCGVIISSQVLGVPPTSLKKENKLVSNVGDKSLNTNDLIY